MAVEITISRGTAAALVQRPSRTRSPQPISNMPTKCAVKNGCGNPIRVKRVIPIAGSINLRMPCVKKIRPTARRMRKMAAGPCTGLKRNRRGVPMRSEYSADWSFQASSGDGPLDLGTTLGCGVGASGHERSASDGPISSGAIVLRGTFRVPCRAKKHERRGDIHPRHQANDCSQAAI
jgi:hypothetical protein